MLHKWCFEIIKVDESKVFFTFECTKRQIDKLFYSLAFASFSSDIAFVNLYLHFPESSGKLYRLFKVNTYRSNDPFYRLGFVSEMVRRPDTCEPITIKEVT